MFENWNHYFGVNIENVISVWGQPTKINSNRFTYISEDDWILVIFRYMDNKITEIEIMRNP
jgi:hypothetical protein